MNAFLELNDVLIHFPEDETVEIMVGIATSNISLQNLSEHLRKNHI